MSGIFDPALQAIDLGGTDASVNGLHYNLGAGFGTNITLSGTISNIGPSEGTDPGNPLTLTLDGTEASNLEIDSLVFGATATGVHVSNATITGFFDVIIPVGASNIFLNNVSMPGSGLVVFGVDNQFSNCSLFMLTIGVASNNNQFSNCSFSGALLLDSTSTGN
ncbi:unnamed protein product, partial [marine sediment metagenome]